MDDWRPDVGKLWGEALRFECSKVLEGAPLTWNSPIAFANPKMTACWRLARRGV
jgi:hypothetical protein